MLSGDESSKVVIFSEWVEVLRLLRHALSIKRINFRDGSEVSDSTKFGQFVESFRASREGGALLLPLRRAGAGLNLNEAQHVILVEPWLDLRLEKQSISRIHKLGQTKETYVHRIVVEDTIGDRILNSPTSVGHHLKMAMQPFVSKMFWTISMISSFKLSER